MTNKEKFAETYAQAFVDSYPELPADKSKHLIEKALKAALDNIGMVDIKGKAFALTFKRLGIKNTYTAIREYLA